MFQIKTSNNPAVKAAIRNIEIIESQLSQNYNLTWLLAGGSASKVYEEMNDLLELDVDFTKLNISLGDERYSEDPNHKGATWPLYEDIRLFKELKKRGANMFGILSGKSLEKDADRFNNFLRERLKNSDYIFCNLGIGIDSHTAGIIPMGERDLFEEVYPANRLAVGHIHGGVHPKRITVTPGLLQKSNKITVYFTGVDKKPVLEKLNTFKELEKMQNAIFKHPALITSLMSAEVFTDQTIS
ncbi:6-phosphogluconolactonase [Candidatus Dojkabacteria bacterium]|uniref:6-phosphogluconolactonase n=1 Tax=Candidatus Dojkabacteria bacterium TaxID=2099670 RepID=A0A955I7B2_9BACT|nr:6-phosphogluconolactonase [Candidatus Dojkabacteria bacterium]